MKKYLKSWNKFETTLFLLSIILILGVGIFLDCELLSIIVSFLGIFSALNQAKGKVLGQFLGVLLSILYSYMSYHNRYFGEVIINLCMLLPMYMVGIYTWSKNKDKSTDNVKQNDIHIQEWIGLLIVNVILFVGLYFLLKYFNTSQLLFSTLSMIINLTATYLLVRRSKYSFVLYLINSFILLFLWVLPVLEGNYKIITMVFYIILLIVNNIYGTIKWMKQK